MSNIINRLYIISFCTSLLLVASGCVKTRPIDLIVHNAKIYTVNNSFDIARAMAIDKGKIIAIGAENEILNKYYPKQKIDAKTKSIYPGFIFNDFLSEKDVHTIEKKILQNEQLLFKYGITTVKYASLSKNEIELLDKLQQNGKLKINVFASINSTPETLKYYLKQGPYCTEKFNASSFRFNIIDSLTSYTSLKEHADLIYKKRFQLKTCVSKNTPINSTIDIYARLLKGTNDRRWSILNADLISNKERKKLRTFNIIPTINPHFEKNTLMQTSNTFRELLSKNGLIVLTSEFNKRDRNPIAILQNTPTIQENNDQYSLSKKEILRSMTIWAAIANFEEKKKGSLEIGKSADFIILNHDLMNKKNTHPAKVIQTFIGGESVYSLY